MKNCSLKNIDKGNGWDMAMCYNLRLNNIFMWINEYRKVW